jgi:hypothetical protein
MESTSQGLNEVSCTSEESSARTKLAKGKSLRACVTKAVGWTLEKANDVLMQEDHINKMA